MKKVATYNGELVLLKNCKKIKGEYYVKGISCFLINDKWYSINSDKIWYDNITKIYKTKNNKIRNCMALKSLNPYEIGYVEINDYYFCIGINKYGNKILCSDYNIFKNAGWIEHVNLEEWHEEVPVTNPIKINTIGFNKLPVKSYVKNFIESFGNNQNNLNIKRKFTFKNNVYNIEDSNSFEILKDKYNNFKVDLSKDVKQAAKLIGDISFGTEIEVNNGSIQQYYLNQLGVYVCKDGSIGYTPEFVTVPYSGAKGLQSLNNLFTHVNKRCDVNYTCSLHYHIGNIRTDREFLVGLYKLITYVQEDLFKMLPYYKKNPDGVKEKNYCKKLSKSLYSSVPYVNYKQYVNTVYSKIQTFLLDNVSPSQTYNRKNKIHPNGKAKWNYPRYNNVNFINMFINNRNTIEFRKHHAITDPTRAINWLFICVAIIRFAEKNSARLLKEEFNLTDVLNYYKTNFKTEYSSKVSEYLIAYYKSRCEYFANNSEDVFAEKDVTNTNYEFSYNGMSGIF